MKLFYKHRWPILLAVTAIAIAVIMQIPQWLHARSPLSRGIPVQLNSDEDLYLARVQEALTGRLNQTAEAIVGDPALKSSNPAFIEEVEGVLFQWTGWRAATIEQVMDSVTPPLIFLALVLFFSLCGFSRSFAYAGAILFIVIELYSLNRPVQQRDSFLLLLLALDGIIMSFPYRRYFGVAGGVALGLLMGAYFWAWTFGWMWLAILFCGACAHWIRQRTPGSVRHVLTVCGIGIVGVIAAVPAVLDLMKVLQSPFSADAQFRSGLHPSHLPESWIYSILFALMVGGVLLEVWRRPAIAKRYPFVIVTVLTAFVVMNQQVLHGFVFDFVSHYLFSLAMAAIGVLLLALTLRTRPMFLAGAAAAVYLLALGYDGRHVISQFRVEAGRFQEQHFESLLPVLDELPRSTILTDPQSSLFIAAQTSHDVVYTVYLQNALMSNQELAERYCLTQIFVAPAERQIENAQPLIYPAAERAFRNDPSVRTKEVELVMAACAQIDKNPAAVLRKFGVQYILWDQERQPAWNLRRLRFSIKKAASGSGWSLWKLSWLPLAAVH